MQNAFIDLPVELVSLAEIDGDIPDAQMRQEHWQKQGPVLPDVHGANIGEMLPDEANLKGASLICPMRQKIRLDQKA